MRTTIAVLVFACFSALASPALAAPHYPMSPDEYQETITRRVETTWSKIEKKLVLHKVSEERRSEIREAFDDAVSKVNEAIEKASEDDKITRGEAFRINTMTSGLRGKLRGKLAREKGAASAHGPDPDKDEDIKETIPASDKKGKKVSESAPNQRAGKAAPRPGASDDPPATKGSPDTKASRVKRR